MLVFRNLGASVNRSRVSQTGRGRWTQCNSLANIFAGSLESANSSILAARRLFKDFGGEKIRIL